MRDLLTELAASLRDWVEPHALRHVDAAVGGDADAAFALAAAVSNGKRGALAVAFWEAGVAVPAFRKLLGVVWDHDHQHLMTAARTRPRLRAMFGYADFPRPVLPKIVPIWRGTSGITRAKAIKRIAWTVDRDVACWFAMRFVKHTGRPLVLRSEVPLESIVLFHDEGGEREVVVFDVADAWRDGDPSDWRTAYERWEREKNQSQRELLATHRR